MENLNNYLKDEMSEPKRGIGLLGRIWSRVKKGIARAARFVWDALPWGILGGGAGMMLVGLTGPLGILVLGGSVGGALIVLGICMGIGMVTCLVGMAWLRVRGFSWKTIESGYYAGITGASIAAMILHIVGGINLIVAGLYPQGIAFLGIAMWMWDTVKRTEAKSDRLLLGELQAHYQGVAEKVIGARPLAIV